MYTQSINFCNPSYSDSVEAVPEVDNQPLLLNEHLLQFNIHKLTELPHALAKSGEQAHEALRQLLLDYQWLKACILSLPCRDILHDFTPVIPTVPIGRYTNISSTHYTCNGLHFYTVLNTLISTPSYRIYCSLAGLPLMLTVN